jgi:4-phosphopantoate--beta-alanine ligase
MREFEADPSHPRYHSLWLRHKLELAQNAGMLANSAMIAHGRGEAFDYLLGEKTIDSARLATKIAAATLQNATKPIICLNGNTTALAADTMLQIADLLQCPIEINIFYRTDERMEALINYLSERKKELNLNVEILGESPDYSIPGLKGPRASCCWNGIGESDVVFVPLEDGDRCEALRKMGKFVIVVDLNPLSRSAQKASLTIIDEITRVGNNLLEFVNSPIKPETYQNEFFIQDALSHITHRFL